MDISTYYSMNLSEEEVRHHVLAAEHPVHKHEEAAKIAQAIKVNQYTALWLTADGKPSTQYDTLLTKLSADNMTPVDLAAFYTQQQQEETVRHAVLAREHPVHADEEERKIAETARVSARDAVWLAPGGSPSAKYSELIAQIGADQKTPLDLSLFYSANLAAEEVRARVLASESGVHASEEASKVSAALAVNERNAVWLTADGALSAKYRALLQSLEADGLTPVDLAAFYSARLSEEAMRHAVLAKEGSGVHADEEAAKLAAARKEAERVAVWCEPDGTPSPKYLALVAALGEHKMTPLCLAEHYATQPKQ